MAAAAQDNVNLGGGADRPAPAAAAAAAAAAAMPTTPGVMQRFRSVLLTFGSFVLTALVVVNAWFQRQQFYPSVVYITKSNPRCVVRYAFSHVR